MNKELISREQQILTYLKSRFKLSSSSKRRLQQLKRGYIGEKKFKEIIKQNLHDEYLLLHNLLLESDGSFFQIDYVIIINNTIYLYEIKNYNGDYYVHDDRWYMARSKMEIRNPLRQLERSTYLLKQVLHKFPKQFKVESFIVFVDEGFMLYNAPIHPQLIFPGQIDRHMEFLNEKMTATIISTHQKEVFQWFNKQQTVRSFSNIPEYHFDELDKGIFCNKCTHKMARYNRLFVTCQTCLIKENIETATLRSVKQFITLFPNKRITTNLIYKWCGGVLSRKTILRTLKKHFNLIYCGKNSFFVKPSENEHLS